MEPARPSGGYLGMPDPQIPTTPDPAPPYEPPQPDNDPGLPGEPDPAPAYDPPEPDTVM